MGWIALLGPLIPVLVTGVERLFGKKNGPTKLDTVVSAITPILTSLVNAQALGGPMPPQADVVAEINAVVAKLFPPGTTYSTATDPLAIPTVPIPPVTIPSAPVVAPYPSLLLSDQKLQLIKAVLAL